MSDLHRDFATSPMRADPTRSPRTRHRVAGAPPGMCSRCRVRPSREKQRWCKECHAEYQREHRADRSYYESGAGDDGPLSGVYFIQCSSFVKIGVSSDVIARFRSIKSSNPFAVVALGFIPEPVGKKADDLETSLHRRFAGCRHQAEWFTLTDELLAFIATDAKPWPNQLTEAQAAGR